MLPKPNTNRKKNIMTMTTVNTGTTAITALEASKEWMNLIGGCFLDDIYDDTQRCMECEVKYYAHDYSDDACDEFEDDEASYVDQERISEELVETLIELHSKTMHLPFTDLSEQTVLFSTQWEIVEEFIGIMCDDDADLDEVWTWLLGWENAHKK